MTLEDFQIEQKTTFEQILPTRGSPANLLHWHGALQWQEMKSQVVSHGALQQQEMKAALAQAESCCVYVKPQNIMQNMHVIIPQLFHCWADPVVHLFLLKISITQDVGTFQPFRYIVEGETVQLGCLTIQLKSTLIYSDVYLFKKSRVGGCFNSLPCYYILNLTHSVDQTVSVRNFFIAKRLLSIENQATVNERITGSQNSM